LRIAIFGVDGELVIESGQIGLINIRNQNLYRKIQKKLYRDLENNLENEIVFFEDKERLINEIVYVQDVESYTFNNKQFLDAFCKRIINEINTDLSNKTIETESYAKLLKPFINDLNLLEIEYSLKEELDQTFYTKIPNISFKDNDELDCLDKILNIIKINNKLLRKKYFVFNRIHSLLTRDELISLNKFVKCSDVSFLLVDCLNENDIKIKNNVNIFEDFSSFTIINENMI